MGPIDLTKEIPYYIQFGAGWMSMACAATGILCPQGLEVTCAQAFLYMQQAITSLHTALWASLRLLVI